MRTKSCVLFLAISLTLSIPGGVKAQSFKTNPRPNIETDAPLARGGVTAQSAAQLSSAEAASPESLVPRDGLRFYVEIRNSGLTELVKSPSTIQSFAKLLSSGPVKTATSDLTSFVVGNHGLLSKARFALAGYNAGTLVLIETSNAAAAEQLHPGVATLVGRSRVSNASASAVEVVLVGSVVLVGRASLQGSSLNDRRPVGCRGSGV